MSSAGKKGTREKLLQAARAELIKGNGDLELAKVAKRAKVSDGLTYYHFSNKAGLIQALVDDYYRLMDEQVIAITFDGDTWAEREKQRVDALIAFFYSDPAAMIIATRLRTDPSLSGSDTLRDSRLHELGAKNIAQAQKTGEIDPALNATLLVAMILAGAIEGAQSALSAAPRISIEAAQREVWSFVARAAGVSPD